ncbi:MAG: hydantoinase/oxoprolinase family protein [Planctomycetota bacterium]
MTQVPAKYRVGVDIGGTFTDLILVQPDTGSFWIGKVLTTPEAPDQAVEQILLETLQRANVPPEQIEVVIHGTTLVTNAMIERKGATTALFATEGFRDVVEIGRETRYDLYDLMLEQPRPIVPRHLRFDISQRTRADGETVQQLDESKVKKLAAELDRKGISAIAVCYLHSFTNPSDERRTRQLIHDVAPQIRVSISSDVVPEIREFERTSTTIANVYVQQLVEVYLQRLEQRLNQSGVTGSFYLMHSSGGVATVETTIRFPYRLLESGPAAGALAAKSYGMAAGKKDLISFDMGGTTAKICVIDQGEPLIAHEFEVDRIYRFKKGSGLPIKLPVIELIEIGTGGGSIARVDSMGLLKVGPDSAGAEPGPVCYGRGGTEPTLTDANLILGYLDPDFFLGGELTLDVDAAKQAIQTKIADPLGFTIERAAWGIYQIANENMANAARVHALERGKDPRRFTLFAFGGGGPVQAYRIAKAIGVPELMVPLGAGIMSTVGFLSAPLSFDFVRSWNCILDQVDWNQANQILFEMEQSGRQLLSESGLQKSDIQFQRTCDMRYYGQGFEISVDLPSGILNHQSAPKIRNRFESAYQELYERNGPPVEIEITNWRVVASGPTPKIKLQMASQEKIQGVESAIKGKRRAWFPESQDYVETPVFDRYLLGPGLEFSGPAIVEEKESTVIVGPGAQCQIDEHFNLIVALPQESVVAPESDS